MWETWQHTNVAMVISYLLMTSCCIFCNIKVICIIGTIGHQWKFEIGFHAFFGGGVKGGCLDSLKSTVLWSIDWYMLLMYKANQQVGLVDLKIAGSSRRRKHAAFCLLAHPDGRKNLPILLGDSPALFCRRRSFVWKICTSVAQPAKTNPYLFDTARRLERSLEKSSGASKIRTFFRALNWKSWG